MSTLTIDEAVAAVANGSLTTQEAVLAVSPAAVEAVLHAQLQGQGEPLATGVGASAGAASGRVYFDVDSCLDAVDRGEPVLFVGRTTTPAAEPALRVANGVLTSGGGAASHAAVIARGWGLPAVCGVEALSFDGDTMRCGDLVVKAGDYLSIDGTTGEVFAGDLASASVAATSTGALDQLLGWADEVRAGRIGIRANADTGADVALARSFGAEGVGLCRTEHLFLGEQLPLLQSVLRAEAGDAAMDSLVEAQRADFLALLNAADGMPTVIRLLDAPFHEFLPGDQERLEQNPMLGIRGVRLAIVRDGLFQMQIHALLAAISDREADGHVSRVDIMIPMVADAAELALVTSTLQSLVDDSTVSSELRIGTMIETPRAALTAGQLATVAAFFSFGTNDLTQLTWGLSRDDVEGSVVRHYQTLGLLESNPFERLDESGVGALLATAVAAARSANPALEIGVCGEHAGDPASVPFLVALGVDYVSCSPYRVPVARLALAQALGANE